MSNKIVIGSRESKLAVLQSQMVQDFIVQNHPDMEVIRDSETAAIAARAAITGHLVLSTLHTNDSISAVHRI